MSSHKKPRGTPYHYETRLLGDRQPQQMKQTKLLLPNTKASIESTIAAKFINDAATGNLGIELNGALIQNDESDIDFTVRTEKGDIGLELVEYAPLGKGGYKDATAMPSNPVERAKSIVTLIAAKNKKYESYSKHRDVVLLIYVTHNPFALDIYTIRVLQFWGRSINFAFHTIVYYKPMEGIPGLLQRIFPITDEEASVLRGLKVPRCMKPVLP